MVQTVLTLSALAGWQKSMLPKIERTYLTTWIRLESSTNKWQLFCPTYSRGKEDTSSTDTCVDQKEVLEVLEELGFASKAPPQEGVNNDKIWHTKYDRLVEFKRKNGNCLVPAKYEQGKTLGLWVCKQRTRHTTKTIRP
jgi:hypothetical protein